MISFPAEFLDGFFTDPLQFLVYNDQRPALLHRFVRDIHTVPGEAEHFPHAQRSGKSQVQCHLQLPFPGSAPEDQVQVIGRVLGIVSSSDCPNPLEMESVEVIRHDEILDFKRKHGMRL